MRVAPRDRRWIASEQDIETATQRLVRRLLSAAHMYRVTMLVPVLVACATDDHSLPTPFALPEDAYFIGVFVPYKSPQHCIESSPDPRGCRFAITLCRDGRAAQRMADIVSEGTYDMIDGIAHARFTEGTSLEFDVALRKRAGDAPNTSWIFDVDNLHESLLFDTIDCSRGR